MDIDDLGHDPILPAFTDRANSIGFASEAPACAAEPLKSARQ
jgi:hypothetical protein